MHLIRTIILLIALAIVPGASFASERVALVIGNSDYAFAGKLPNPRNDSADIAASLKRLGFEVTVAQDASYAQLRQSLGEFSRKALGAEMAMIFYAGHGMEVNKQNYLIPTDAKLETDLAVAYEAIPLDLATEAVSGARGLKLVILDACRNNPFMASMKKTNATRSIGRGLARIEPVAGTLVAYSSKEGTVADDGKHRVDRHHAADQEGNHEQAENGDGNGGKQPDGLAEESRKGA